jgi:aminopeptidase N
MGTRRTAFVAAGLTAALAAAAVHRIPVASAAEASAGVPGAGDSYFPLDGNGGFDVGHYDLRLDYDPPSRRLVGHATITATATQDLGRFDLDLSGFTVNGVSVDETAAAFSRDGQELVVTPKSAIRSGTTFAVAVDYAGVPEQHKDSRDAPIGWSFTDDGAYVASEPNGSHTWYPCSDHPSDKATFDFTITVPKGTAAVANGRLTGTTDHDGKTTYTWSEPEPMATYVSTATVGRFTLATSTLPNGVVMTTAVQPDKLDASRAALQDDKYKTATTRDFQALAERTSGKDLDALVRAWVYTPSQPPYTPKPR